ncbi:hypothetical protein F4604DRAFT_1916068 [Suillus subluteus]|nr:hypothetical protein F4604DRAFT_1916068 [Suillus subluteus]
MEHFWPLQKEPLGYIAMNDHRGPLVKASGRAEYEVLVPIFGLTPQDKDVLSQNVEVVSRVYYHNLITVWMWPELDRKFIAKLAPWPYGHYSQVIFDSLDDIIDDMATEDFEDGSFSQIYTDAHTTASFQQHYHKCFTFLDVHQLNMIEHNVYGFVPSSSELGSALMPAILPVSPCALVPSQAPTSDGFVAVDELMLPQIVKLSEDLRWTTHSAPDDLGFCLDANEWHAKIARMMAVLDEAAVQLDQGQDQHLAPFDYRIVIEILGLQMAKELWHYMILRPVASNPNVCVADLYWEVLDREGNPNMNIISLIVCLKVLNRQLNRTGDASVIKIYRRIAHLHGPPLMEIQEVTRDLGYIREFNVYGIDKDGNRRRANICPIIKSYDCPPSQTSLGTQYLQPPIDDSFFHIKSKPGLGVA